MTTGDKTIIKHIIKNENGGCDIGFSCHIIPPLVQEDDGRIKD